jgi:cell filamentation protein
MSADPYEGVAQDVKRGIEQTLAAQRIEGWRPTADNIADLVLLAHGQVRFGEYLAKYIVRQPVSNHQPPRRIFRRSRPYLIPGKTVLRNNFGTESQEVLAELEFVATAGRITQWHCRIGRDDVSLRDVDFAKAHQHVFADVYAWAGDFRITELRKGETLFAWQSEIRPAMQRITWAARRLAEAGGDLDSGALAYRFARIYAEYNRVHPFREGNGRAGTLVLHTVAALCGRRLDLSAVTRDAWTDASRDSMPPRRSGEASHRPFLPLFVRAVT